MAALQEVARPASREHAIEAVYAYARELQRRYPPNLPLSAASKFLWMRFKRPVIIYDSKAFEYLKKRHKLPDEPADTFYERFCEAWQQEYEKVEHAIRVACGELVAIRRFTLAGPGSDGHIANRELREWTSSAWFRERVFDHSMLNAMEAASR
jgi:hypothetical protein